MSSRFPIRSAALRRVAAYIGDGATITRNVVRRDEISGQPIGHATIRAQLDWCRAEGVSRMIVTHCGSDIVGDEKRALVKIRALAHERGIDAVVAYDGMELSLGKTPRPRQNPSADE